MSRFKAILTGAAASAALVLGSAGAASAVYPPNPGGGTIDVQGTIGASAEGTPVVVTAEDGFCPVPGTWTYVLNPGGIALAEGGATPAGPISITGTLPALEPGTYTATFTCNPTLTATFTIAADGTFASITDSGGSTGGGGGEIVPTGSNSTTTTLQIAAIAVAAGLGMLGLAAIRRRSAPAAA